MRNDTDGILQRARFRNRTVSSALCLGEFHGTPHPGPFLRHSRMLVAAGVEVLYGVKAEKKSLETVAKPLCADGEFS